MLAVRLTKAVLFDGH
ncbi:hypothetical protein VCCP1040_2819, partial [Vibrio cholerae CP1040(13)]